MKVAGWYLELKKMAASATVVAYDLMFRLQFLEGVAHVPVNTWMTHGKQGLIKARKWFEDKGFANQMDPSWFVPEPSGMYMILSHNIQGLLNRNSRLRGTDPLDIINTALYGLSKDLSERARPIYESGKFLGTKTLAGEETPVSVAKGSLGKLFSRRVIDIITGLKRETSLPTDDEGEPLDIEDKRSDIPAWQVLSSLLFRDTDPLAQKAQHLLAEVFSQSGPMTYWLEHIRAGQEPPKAKDIAEKFGIAPSSFGQRHFFPLWKKFFDKLWGSSDLRSGLSLRLEQMGADSDLPDAIESFNDKVTLKTSSRRVAFIKLSYLYPESLFRG